MAAVAAEPASAWTSDATFSALSSAPTDASGPSATSLFTSHDSSTVVAAQPTPDPTPTYTSVSAEYGVQENLPKNGVGVTSQALLDTAVYVKVKKLGIAKALGGTNVFPLGEQEMLDRIEITGFTIDTSTTPPSVVTKFTIKNIDTTTTGPGSGLSITNAISDASTFATNVLSETATAIANEPATAWTSSDSIFSSAPTDQAGGSAPSGTSLFAVNTTVTAGQPAE